MRPPIRKDEPMGYLFPLNADVQYIIEERNLSNPNEVSFAWIRNTPEEAIELLAQLVAASGMTRLYTAYLNIEA